MGPFSNFLAALATVFLIGTAYAVAIEHDISIVPAGSITTITSIYTSVDTQVISPTVAVWTDGTTTTRSTIPVQTPTPSVVTSVTTETFASSTSTTTSSTTLQTQTTTAGTPTTIIIDATSSTAPMATASTVTGAHKKTLPVGAYVGMAIGAAVVLIALICFCMFRKKLKESKWFPFARPRHSKPGYNASTADKDEEERKERSRLSTQRRQDNLKAYVNSNGVKDRLKSWVHGQARDVSDPTLTHIGSQPVPPGHTFTRAQSDQPPVRPIRPTSRVDSMIATMQHSRPDSRPITQYFGDEENGIELEETGGEIRSYRPVYDPYIPTAPESLQPPRPRRAASSIYSQQTSQPYWARGSVNTNTMDNAINSTMEDFSRGSAGSTLPPHYSVYDEQVYEQPPSAAGPSHGRSNTYSQYRAGETAPRVNLPTVDRYQIDEDEDDEEKRERERKRALDLLMGNEPEPERVARSVRDTGLSAIFGIRKINK